MSARKVALQRTMLHGLPGEMVTRYYRLDIDGSVQPYTVRLPRNYDPTKKYSVVVQQH